ncbi:MAG: hypothetical protein ACRECU_09255 [Methylocella sp.]
MTIHPHLVGSPLNKGQIYVEKATTQWASNWKDSTFHLQPDSSIKANDKRAAVPLERATTLVFFNQTARVGKLNHLLYEQTLSQPLVLINDADPQGLTLAGKEQETRDGLPRLSGFVGFACPTVHCKTPKIVGHIDHVMVGAWPCVAALWRSMRLAADAMRLGAADNAPDSALFPYGSPSKSPPIAWPHSDYAAPAHPESPEDTAQHLAQEFAQK